jgi:hypothetical protein
MMKSRKKNGFLHSSLAATLVLGIGFFFAFQSQPSPVRDFSVGPVIIGNFAVRQVQDFSVIPDIRIWHPFPVSLPEGKFIPPRCIPLPRDLDRDFDP